MSADGDTDRAMGLAEREGYVQNYVQHQYRLDPNSFGTLLFVK